MSLRHLVPKSKSVDFPEHTLTTCTFCGVGCGIYLETAGGLISGAYPSMTHPANEGRICVRGWHVHEVSSSPDRLTQPLIKKDGEFIPVRWDQALDFVSTRLRMVRKEHGPDSIAFLNSPRCSNEETYLLQKFARTIIGTNNVDRGGALHRINTVDVLQKMIGIPAATSSIEDLDKADLIIVDGIDLGRQLPTIGGRVLRAKLAGAKLMVIGSRSQRIGLHADLTVRIKPDTDLLLYGAMAKTIVDRGLMNLKFIKEHCTGYEEWLERIQDFDILWAAEHCGVEPELIEEAALTYAKASSAMLLYSTGVEARGKGAIQALVSLCLLCGHIGREGAGLMPLAEYNNLQGGCDMGMLPDRLPAYRHVSKPEERAELEELWGRKLPAKPGLDIWSMFAPESPVRALWIDRLNPIVTAALADAAEKIQKLDLLVVQHLFMTETAKLADVVLPIVAFGEERVTFTSTERRIQIAEKAIDPPDGPIPAWEQIVAVANRMGANWNYQTAADVMDEIGRAVPFYSGAAYENLWREYGRQWPCTKDKPLGTRRLFEDGLPRKGFRFIPLQRPEGLAKLSAQYPFVLAIGYSLYYWHRNVLVQHSETLRREYGILLLDYPNGFVEINTEDARRLGLRDGAPVRLVAKTGSVETTARITDEVRPGTVFLPYFQTDIARKMQWDEAAKARAGNSRIFVRVEKV
ncbi:MAG TPA: molybdopterin-dependent oxidoreductase [Acidobacteriota bacterium]|nr:molybdopterin-dependent oxidoreductase [Acidobacteriota bacterium]